MECFMFAKAAAGFCAGNDSILLAALPLYAVNER